MQKPPNAFSQAWGPPSGAGPNWVRSEEEGGRFFSGSEEAEEEGARVEVDGVWEGGVGEGMVGV